MEANGANPLLKISIERHIKEKIHSMKNQVILGNIGSDTTNQVMKNQNAL